MIEVSQEDNRVFEFCERWVALLASREYEAACAALYRSEVGGWTSDTIRIAIETYGTMEYDHSQLFRVTKFEDAVGENPRESMEPLFEIPNLKQILHPTWPITITWVGPELLSENGVGTVDLQYALNGEWSDLSSNFYIHRVADGVAFELGRIDVA